jgi:hypothetical protein
LVTAARGVAWLVREQILWKGVDVWMRAEELERVEAQDYRRVPRRIDDDVPSECGPQPTHAGRPRVTAVVAAGRDRCCTARKYSNTAERHLSRTHRA